MHPSTDTRTYAAEPADLPRGTLVELFLRGLEVDKADALRYAADGSWHSISHAEIREAVLHAGLGLQALGIERGDRLGLLSENRPEWALADYATLCAGGIDVPIYATLPANQVAYPLRGSGARLVFVSSAEQLAKVREVRGELPALEHIVVFDDVASGADDVIGWRELLERGRAAAEREAAFWDAARGAKPDDVATIIYTSGTTGEPKGVMLTHDNLFSNVTATQKLLQIDDEEVSLSFLPLSHVFERMLDYWYFRNGCTIAYVASFDRVAQSLAEVRPTIVASTPRVYEKLYAKVLSATGPKRRLVMWARRQAIDWADAVLEGSGPGLGLRVRHAVADRLVFGKLRERIGGRLKYFVSGGGPLEPTINKFFYGAGVKIFEGYGLTESSPVTNVNVPGAQKIGTVGRPIPGTEIRIADDGEILARGPQIMKGYYNRPDATREAVDAEGWLRTGDIGELDAEGFLRITDRKKDLIVTAGGKNIAPQPIENRAKTSRYVAEAVMIGDRRPYPVLLVVPNMESLREWARRQGIEATDARVLIQDPRVRDKVEREVFRSLEGFARYEMPKKIGLLAEEFTAERDELTPTLKVKRRVVQERRRELIDAIYGESETVAAE